MNDTFHWWTVPAIVIPAAVAAPAYAVQYFTIAQAQRALFPNTAAFVSRPVALSAARKDFIEDYSGVRVRAERQPVWRAEADGQLLGWFVLDEVYGKHEFITYAVALDPQGGVRGIEILDYRETHGGEVRDKRWQAQFLGKHYGDRLKLGDTVQNISGATLSCKHITEGVRRVLALYETALKEGAGQ